MKKLVIISGLSGSGKTTVSNYLEDKGFYCIDQYPPELYEELINLIQSEKFKYDNIALTVSLPDLEKYASLIYNFDLKPIFILLDSSTDVIINRYKFTRRVHPLLINGKAGTLSEAIEIEKTYLEKHKNNSIIIDTSSTSSKQLKEKLDEALSNKKEGNISISFVSFGFKNGIPKDTDAMFDVRFLDNPFYDPKLRKKTGNEKAVREYVLDKPKTQRYLKKLIAYLDFMFKAYDQNDDKRHLTICIGCTGGQHRSVTIANYLYKYYKDKYSCYIKHRELS
ncbi:MAG: RNase adapter RapZ [Erysipelotrichaceae bacterium]|nr:RNase adapter RapZ [Erysipelotrichaceae bacterium]